MQIVSLAPFEPVVNMYTFDFPPTMTQKMQKAFVDGQGPLYFERLSMAIISII